MDTNVTIELAVLARELGLPEEQLVRTVELLDEGNTVPFITRYRKDRTGGLDEEQIREIHDHVTRARMLAERKRTILKSIESQSKLTEDLATQIKSATSTKRLEDLYLPFKPKKQTLATVARERGLEPLEREILGAEKIAEDLDRRSLDFVDIDKGIRSQADVLLGVGHLIAEHFSERAELREALRRIVRDTGKIVCSRAPVVEEEKPNVVERASRPAQASEAPIEETNKVASESNVEQVPRLAQEEKPPEATAADSPEVAAEVKPEETNEAEVATESEAVAKDANDVAKPPAGEAATTDEPQASAETSEQNVTHEPTSETEAPTPETATPEVDPEEAKRIAKAEEAARKKQQRAERKKRKDEEKKRKRKQKENAFKDYFKFEESIGKLPPHRILAINRGEKARVLRVKLDADMEAMRVEAEKLAIPENHLHAEFLRGCLKDALTRLIFPALEREVRRELTEKSEDHAVTVFARNLRHLLLTQPVSRHRVLAIDPGFRSGCKLAALDEFGNLHGHGAIYLVGPEERKTRSRARLVEMIKLHHITVVAIGNGTACRETEQLVADVLANELKGEDLSYVIVNEAGASVYSTSPVGREELGQYEAVQRSAVSIGRRLLDPLSELVKINPANIGVGLYQHDMKAKHLQDSLDAVVESCVNYVGVDLNTASQSLLRYVSGLNQLTARRIDEYRQKNGPFPSREKLKDVPGVGEATYIQAAGFLKISGGENPLDATWIHPESYDSARQILVKLDCDVDALAAQVKSVAKREDFAAGLNAETTVQDASENTTSDEVTAAGGLADEAATTETPTAVEEATPEATAEETPPDAAVVTSEEKTEAESEPAPNESAEATNDSVPEPTAEVTGDGDVAAPAEPKEEVAAEVNQATTELVEKASKADAAALAGELKIGELLCRDILTALVRPGRDPREDLPSPLFRREILKLEDLKPGMQLQGTVLNVVDFGAFVDIGLHDTGLVHISRLADRYIKDPHEVVGVGDTLNIWVMEVDKKRRRVQLTAIKPGTERPPRSRRAKEDSKPGESREGQGRGRGRSQGDKAKSGDRPPRKRRDKRDDRKGGGRHQRPSGPAQPFELVSKKEPKKKLTKAMKEGRAPLRTFGDLAQFVTLKEEPKEEKPAKKEKKPKDQPETDETPKDNGSADAGDA